MRVDRPPKRYPFPLSLQGRLQKIGYSFPLARADCYISDIIMRQYVSVKAELGSDFTFNYLHKVYGIILMEQSPGEFHKAAGYYIHKRKPVFDTGIYKDNPGLHEDIFRSVKFL